MKFFLTITSLCFILSVHSQPSVDKHKTIIEVTDSNYVLVSMKWKYKETQLISEGYVQSDVKITAKNFHQYRHGIWIFHDYQNLGTGERTEEYYYGVKLGVYSVNLYDGSWRTYSMVKQGNSTITYYDEKGKKTEEHVFDLNDPTRKTVKYFYDKKGNITKTETWLGDKLVG